MHVTVNYGEAGRGSGQSFGRGGRGGRGHFSGRGQEGQGGRGGFQSQRGGGNGGQGGMGNNFSFSPLEFMNAFQNFQRQVNACAEAMCAIYNMANNDQGQRQNFSDGDRNEYRDRSSHGQREDSYREGGRQTSGGASRRQEGGQGQAQSQPSTSAGTGRQQGNVGPDGQRKFGKNHNRNKKYKERVRAAKARLLELEEEKKKREGEGEEGEVSQEGESVGQDEEEGEIVLGEEEVEEGDGEEVDESLLDQEVESVTSEVATLTAPRGQRHASGVSNDSGTSVTSPSPMESSSRQEDLFPSIPQKLCDKVLDHDEVPTSKELSQEQVLDLGSQKTDCTPDKHSQVDDREVDGMDSETHVSSDTSYNHPNQTVTGTGSNDPQPIDMEEVDTVTQIPSGDSDPVGKSGTGVGTLDKQVSDVESEIEGPIDLEQSMRELTSMIDESRENRKKSVESAKAKNLNISRNEEPGNSSGGDGKEAGTTEIGKPKPKTNDKPISTKAQNRLREREGGEKKDKNSAQDRLRERGGGEKGGKTKHSAQDRLREREGGEKGEKSKQSAQDRLKDRKVENSEPGTAEISKTASQKKVDSKDSKIDKSLDAFEWTSQNIFEFVKSSIKRPRDGVKKYNFSLFDKLDKGLNKGKVECDGCKKPMNFYKFGDTIKVLLSSSTLANLKKRDSDKVRKHTCTHFEYLTVSGGNFLDMEAIAIPILKFLQGYFNVEVLIVCGINDLNDKRLYNIDKSYNYRALVDRVRNFNAEICKEKKEPDVKLDDLTITPGELSIRYIGIPYPPAFSKIGNDKHLCKADLTGEISCLNKFFKNLNNKVVPVRKVPTLQYKGISDEPFNHRPESNRHIYEMWHHGSHRWPKDPLLGKDVVHLKDYARGEIWTQIHGYFQEVSKGN